MGAHDIFVQVQDKRWSKAWPACARVMQKTCVQTLEYFGMKAQSGKAASLSIVLTDDAQMRDLNHTYRGKNKPTNVLSFRCEDATQEYPRPLGDIVLAFDTVQREANEQGKTFAHHATHLTLHGMMHLLGFDHETDDEAELMEFYEAQLLKEHGIANPYEAAQ